ncbi:hypothetical protein [Streptomyces sp. NPDC055709]
MATNPVEGTWNLVIATPVGKQRVVLVLTADQGALSGVARDERHGLETALTALTQEGERLTWAQSVTKPMRLNLTFDVTVDGDRMTGKATAGRLPSSTVTGHRATTDPTV